MHVHRLVDASHAGMRITSFVSCNAFFSLHPIWLASQLPRVPSHFNAQAIRCYINHDLSIIEPPPRLATLYTLLRFISEFMDGLSARSYSLLRERADPDVVIDTFSCRRISKAAIRRVSGMARCETRNATVLVVRCIVQAHPENSHRLYGGSQAMAPTLMDTARVNHVGPKLTEPPCVFCSGLGPYCSRTVPWTRPR